MPSFGEWLEGKMKFTVFMLGVVGLAYVSYRLYQSYRGSPGSPVPSSPQKAGGGRYGTLPERCVCQSCGYVVENPGKHCPQLGPCPKCGAPRLWRG